MGKKIIIEKKNTENKPKKNFGNFVFTITDIKEDTKCDSES